MIKSNRLEILSILIMSLLLLFVGFLQSWSLSFSILNMCIISAIMSMGINMQWGYAGIFNVGIMGFTALGGLAAVLVSHAPITEAWSAGGLGIMISFLILVLISLIVYWINRKLKTDKKKYWIITLVIIIGLIIVKLIYHPSVLAIEAVNPTLTGFLGGMGLPIIFSWIVGGFFAAAVAFVIGKITLGLRSDYLAIATLGISEIIITVLKSEEWLSRGVKNVVGLKRPVPYEIDLQQTEWFISAVQYLNQSYLVNIIDKLEYQKVLQEVLIQPQSDAIQKNSLLGQVC